VLRIDRLALDYQARYCEENVWRLLARSELAAHRAWAVMVSSLSGQFLALRQKAGRSEDGLVCWDYHVFAVVDDADGTRLALDLDSALPFPCPLGRYLAESFTPLRQLRRRSLTQPIFRVMTAADYLTDLASDRSHMRKPSGAYFAPPPPWPAPGDGKSNTLPSWIDVSRDSPGVLHDLDHMVAFAEQKPNGAGVVRVVLGASDHARLKAFCLLCNDYYQGTGHRAADEETAKEILGPLESSYSHGRKHVFGYEEDGELIGIAELLEGHPSPRDWYIGLLLLRPDHRGRRLGTTLARDLLDWIATHNAQEIRLVVQSENPRALPFWERLGFAVEKSLVRKTQGHEGLVWILRHSGFG
jgi:ribosomal protein S18 acetylase RimI-like enzyme